MSVRWCVLKAGVGFPDRVWPKTFKWVVVYCNVTFHINKKPQWQVGPVSAYCDGMGYMSCPVSAAWHSCVAAHWSKYHFHKQAPSPNDLRCLKANLTPRDQKCYNFSFIMFSFDLLLTIMVISFASLVIRKCQFWILYEMFILQKRTDKSHNAPLYWLKVLYYRRGCKNSFQWNFKSQCFFKTLTWTMHISI